MSYYHYFKLKKDSKCKDTELKKFYVDKTDKYKILLKGAMIKAYYEENLDKKLNLVSIYVKMIGMSITESFTNSYLKEIKEKGEIVRNRPKDDYDMERDVEDYDSEINRIIERLFILSNIKFKSDDTYSYTSKNEMDYLQYEYIDKIESETSYLEDIAGDYAFSKFVTENCIRRTEDGEYPEESSEKE